MMTHEELKKKLDNHEITFDEYMTTATQPGGLQFTEKKRRSGKRAARKQAVAAGLLQEYVSKPVVETMEQHEARLAAKGLPLESNSVCEMCGKEAVGFKSLCCDAKVVTPSEYATTPKQQPLQDAAGPFVAAPANLKTAQNSKNFILAGNAYFTARSVTGTRYTFRVSLAKKEEAQFACKWCHQSPCACPKAWFVSYLIGPENSSDYTYLGMIRNGRFQTTKASNHLTGSKPFLAFRWVWEHLSIGQMPPKTELWHEGRCGRCGHLLTVPESIESGIGPVCESKGGF